MDDLRRFGIKLDKTKSDTVAKLWPGKVSVVLPCSSNKFKYLSRGSKTLAFRLPEKRSLINILKETGPLVAPSANPEGKDPAKNISEAKKYFGTKVDYYIDGGELRSKPSTLVSLEENSIRVLREGSVKLRF